MDNQLPTNLNDADTEYTIVVKKQADILSELTDDPKEILIYESIINGIEELASDTIKNGKVAQLPIIGCVRKDPVKLAMKANYTNFSIARKQMNTVQYKDHVREIIIDAKQTLAKNDKQKHIVKRTRSINKKKYDRLFITLGKAYAEMFIQSILMLREVPYDVAVQEQYDKLNNI